MPVVKFLKVAVAALSLAAFAVSTVSISDAFAAQASTAKKTASKDAKKPAKVAKKADPKEVKKASAKKTAKKPAAKKQVAA